MPMTIAIGQITPRGAGSGNPQYGLNKQPVIASRDTSVAGFARQQILDALPLVIAQPVQQSGCESRPPNSPRSVLLRGSLRIFFSIQAGQRDIGAPSRAFPRPNKALTKLYQRFVVVQKCSAGISVPLKSFVVPPK